MGELDMRGYAICLSSWIALLSSVVVARTLEVSLWRGETTAVRLPDSIEVGKCPEELGMRLGVLRPVRYAPVPNSLLRLEACDRVEWGTEDGGPRDR